MAQPGFQGRFIWQELLCSDTTAATFFYTSILPWRSQPYSPGSPYLLFTVQDCRPVAGAVRLSEDARALGTAAHWRGYIGAADVDAIVAQALRHGARIQQPAQDVPGMGRVALLADPDGAIFGLFRPLPNSAGAVPGAPGFAWNELAARNRESALAFYQRLFRWELRPPIDMGGGFHYQTFGLGGQDIGGAYTIPPDRAMPPAWCPYAVSRSADETAARVVAAGGQVCHGPIGVPGGGRIVQFFDSQHAMFAVHSMGAAPAAAPQRPAAPAVAVARPARRPARKAAKKPAKKRIKKKIAKKLVHRPIRKSTRKPARRKK